MRPPYGDAVGSAQEAAVRFTGFRSTIQTQLSTDAFVFVERVDSFTLGGTNVELHVAAGYELDRSGKIVG